MAGPVVTLETHDMQGLVARAYGHLPFARYLLLAIDDPAAARAWLGQVAHEVATADRRGTGPSLIVAFTHAGLARLGLPDDALATFPRPLQEGMVTAHRSRVLGDSGPSDPRGWRWGGPENPEVHLLVVIYAETTEELGTEHEARRAQHAGALSDVADPIDGLLEPDRKGKEHFGFADGLSQPVLKGWPRRTRSINPPAPEPDPKWEEVNPGEVVLGYPDNYGKPAEGPTISAKGDGPGDLPAAPWAPGRRHLGHNGTFLVFRQLAQDVGAFRRFVAEAVEASAARGTPLTPEQVGAKMVGRWAGGAPLAVHPDADPGHPGTDGFGFHEQDQGGFGCPPGAHVRRSNPRDSTDGDPGKALGSTRNHRILRRGRPYGMAPSDAPAAQPRQARAAERGLLFICLNSDFERQFEFVQHTWLDNGFFAGLCGEVDSLVGRQPEGGGSFTVPAVPVRRRTPKVPQLVTTTGGGYFFLPGVRALRWLAAMG
ncbi:MAG: Dyp-type peroxidase [Acidimicrobiales bacterium]